MKKIILFVTVSLIFSAKSFAQLSPGELSKAHANLEGLSNCTKCHELGDQVRKEKCLSCHKEIKQLINNNRGYHSSAEVKRKDCWKCHSEHNGRNFQVVKFDEKKFDHSKTTFGLKGKHADIKCDECHNSKFISDKNISKRNDTFLGLSTTCKSCHEDFHQGTLGDKCESCHNTETFKKANFDHNKSAFKLTGKHKTVECQNCHKTEKRNGKDFRIFKNIQFQSCENCHSDIHKGKFGSDCKKCHSTEGFKNVNKSNFDHSKTNFQLLGKHEDVKCNDCHGSNLLSKPKHQKCIDCHKDYHKGVFLTNYQNGECSQCHEVTGFSPSLFSFELHSKTKFELTGSHFAVPCRDCHYKTEEWKFDNLSNRCIACHENVHRDEIEEKFMGNFQCDNCHNTDTWHKVKFDHSLTEFPLAGKHVQVKCMTCHEKKNDLGEIYFQFSSLSFFCEDCHKDVHNAQFAEFGKTECEKCHTFSNWNPEKFDHEKTKFSLIGGHQKVLCSACHKKVIENSVTFVKFKMEDFKCKNCHQ
jgi:hypothetical protein